MRVRCRARERGWRDTNEGFYGSTDLPKKNLLGGAELEPAKGDSGVKRKWCAA